MATKAQKARILLKKADQNIPQKPFLLQQRPKQRSGQMQGADNEALLFSPTELGSPSNLKKRKRRRASGH